jgi:hypothetical protein
MAASSIPLASYGVKGHTVFRPGMAVVMPYRHAVALEAPDAVERAVLEHLAGSA